MKKKTLVILCAVLLVVLAGASLLYSTLSGQVERDSLAAVPAETTAPSETAGETAAATGSDYAAPDFTVLDADGQERTLSEFVGKPVILNFWASWCGPCKSEMPDFQEAYEKYGGEIHFLMVNCTGGRETVDSAKAFIQEEGYTFPVYFDTTYEAASAYGASSIPMTIFIDANGDLVTYGVGALSPDLIQKGIDMIYTPAEE